MDRRGFLRRLAAAPIAAVAAAKAAPVAAPLAFHRDAFTFGSVPVVSPAVRFDVLYGWSVLRPDFAVRVLDGEDFHAGDDLVTAEALG